MTPEQQSPGIDEQREFRRLLNVAVRMGWHIPAPDHDEHGPRAWIGYWQARERVQRERAAGNPDPGRPIIPHIPGFRGVETMLERADRIVRNRERWEGWL